MKIGIFHWSFDYVGGGEILANHLGQALNAKVYSVVKDKDNNPLNFIDLSNKLPHSVKLLRKVRSFDYLTWSVIDVNELDDFDIVITSGAATRSLITHEDVMHINYCHSTPRWLYDLWHWRLKRKSKIKQAILIPIGEFFRVWDNSIDARVDYYLCNSPIIQRRLWKYLKRDAYVLYPPIETKKYYFNEYGNYYLYMSRLEEEKRPEEAIRACINANKKLVVLGEGLLEKELVVKYGNNHLIDFRGFVSEEEKLRLLAECRAVIYPAVAEDFGIVPIEAFASGKPVVCANDGFPPIIIGEKNGVVTNGHCDGIIKAIKVIEQNTYNPDRFIAFAEQFDISVFKEKLYSYLDLFINDFERRKSKP